MTSYKCSIVEHENEEIIGYCLNTKCQKQSQYCYQCVVEKKHEDHIQDCKRLNEIFQQISQNIKMLKEKEEGFRSVFEQFLIQEISKQQELQNLISQKCFEVIRNEIGYLKAWQSFITLQKEKTTNQNKQTSWIKSWFQKGDQSQFISENLNYVSLSLTQLDKFQEALKEQNKMNLNTNSNQIFSRLIAQQKAQQHKRSQQNKKKQLKENKANKTLFQVLGFNKNQKNKNLHQKRYLGNAYNISQKQSFDFKNQINQKLMKNKCICLIIVICMIISKWIGQLNNKITTKP